jgi:hypothetical protein
MQTTRPVLKTIASCILLFFCGSFLLFIFFGSYSIDVGKFFRCYDQKQKEILLKEGKPVITIDISSPSISMDVGKLLRKQYQESREKTVRVNYEITWPMSKTLASEWFPDRLGWWKGTVYAGKQTGYIFPAKEIEPEPIAISSGWRHDKTSSDVIMGWEDKNLTIGCSNYLTWKHQRPLDDDQLQKEK